MIKDNLYNRSETHNIKSLSENELVKELAESIKKSDEGKTKSAREVSEGMKLLHHH